MAVSVGDHDLVRAAFEEAVHAALTSMVTVPSPSSNGSQASPVVEISTPAALQIGLMYIFMLSFFLGKLQNDFVHPGCLVVGQVGIRRHCFYSSP
jgi:hypothetical protein